MINRPSQTTPLTQAHCLAHLRVNTILLSSSAWLPRESRFAVDRDKANPMVLRIADIQIAGRIHADTVRALQRGGCRRSPVAASTRLPRPSHRGDQPTGALDPSDTVVFGIDEPDIVMAIDGDF